MESCPNTRGELRYADVAVGAISGTVGTFTYNIPFSMDLEIGHVVWVPFGRQTRPAIVFNISNQTNVANVKDVLGVLHPQPMLSTVAITLARWMSTHYLAPLYDCAALMLPRGLPKRPKMVVRLKLRYASDNLNSLSPKEDYFIEQLEVNNKELSLATIHRKLGTGFDRIISGLEKRGFVERIWYRRKTRIGPPVRKILEISQESSIGKAEISLLQGKRSWRQVQFLEHMIGAIKPVEAAYARREFGQTAVLTLIRRGWVVERQVALNPGSELFRPSKAFEPLKLFQEQENALQKIKNTIDEITVRPRSFLLHGVTGSGKTEIYLQALQYVISRGERGLVLVPEISMTPQMVKRFEERFPGKVAVLHSNLKRQEYDQQWWKVWEGDADVVVGPRSALFAPQKNLGLIIIDEEHEWNYKQQEHAPRYHARETALQLGRETQAVVVLGSATPDIATYHNAQVKNHILLELPQRVIDNNSIDGNHTTTTSSSLADVEIVNMSAELSTGNRSIFSRSLQKNLTETIYSGHQAILFLNRRGSASHVQCRDCGFTQRCRSCAIAVTYHGAGENLLCHQCGSRYQVPLSCPNCWSRRIRFLGIGTQRVVEEVQRLLPGVRVLRWDRDTTAAIGSHQKLMEEFQSGQSRVLVGTQMIAKGLHFPNVTLVGVVLADLGLNLPDFRAGERAFQLLCQVVGRSGRGPVAGRAILQTYDPTHYAVSAAAAQDYRSFYDQEIELRSRYHQPPFCRLARLVFQHYNLSYCQNETDKVSKILRSKINISEHDVVGPAPAFPERVRGLHRWHLLLRTKSDPTHMLRDLKLRDGWYIDVDPVSLT
jgi:primosomal protein N' (replication factor Y)